MSDLLLKIDAEDLARVVPFASENDIRYYLNGVCIEPHEDGAILIATNGHMLAAIQSPDSYVTETCILSLNKRFTTEIRKAGLKRDSQSFVELKDAASYPEVVVLGGRLHRHVAYVSPHRPALVDGKFPEWRKIIPLDDDLVDGLAGSYNARYVQAAAEAAGLANGPRSRYNGIRFQRSKKAGDSGPVIVRTSENRSMIILVMAMRDELTQTMPDWTRAKPEPAKPAAPSMPIEKAAEAEKAAA
jgi:hypothetical protein